MKQLIQNLKNGETVSRFHAASGLFTKPLKVEKFKLPTTFSEKGLHMLAAILFSFTHPIMRLVCRPLLRWVMWTSLVKALKGVWAGWGKIERTGVESLS